MCEVRTRTISYSLFGAHIANLYEEHHSNPAHRADDDYALIAGGTMTVTKSQYQQALTMLAKFNAEIVRRDIEDCFYELDDAEDPSLDDHGAPDSEAFGYA